MSSIQISRGFDPRSFPPLRPYQGAWDSFIRGTLRRQRSTPYHGLVALKEGVQPSATPTLIFECPAGYLIVPTRVFLVFAGEAHASHSYKFGTDDDEGFDTWHGTTDSDVVDGLSNETVVELYPAGNRPSGGAGVNESDQFFRSVLMTQPIFDSRQFMLTRVAGSNTTTIDVVVMGFIYESGQTSI